MAPFSDFQHRVELKCLVDEARENLRQSCCSLDHVKGNVSMSASFLATAKSKEEEFERLVDKARENLRLSASYLETAESSKRDIERLFGESDAFFERLAVIVRSSEQVAISSRLAACSATIDSGVERPITKRKLDSTNQPGRIKRTKERDGSVSPMLQQRAKSNEGTVLATPCTLPACPIFAWIMQLPYHTKEGYEQHGRSYRCSICGRCDKTLTTFEKSLCPGFIPNSKTNSRRIRNCISAVRTSANKVAMGERQASRMCPELYAMLKGAADGIPRGAEVQPCGADGTPRGAGVRME